jgi:tetratricopeptide (TPR) repeat protein
MLHNSIGILQVQIGRDKEALGSYEESVAVLEKLMQTDRTNARPRLYAAIVYENLGVLHRRKRSLADALNAARRSHDLFNELAREQPREASFPGYLASAALHLGEVCRALGRPVEAAPLLKQARELVQKQQNRGSAAHYVLAGVRVQETLLSLEGGRVLTGAEQVRKKQEFDKAMDDLRRAVAAGYDVDEGLDHDAVFEPLWSRPDFQKLVADTKKGAKGTK